jgi:hypothetical protein
VPYARVVTLSTDVNGVAFNQGPITIFAEPRDQRRVETLTYMDFRLSKFFNFGRERSRNLEVILDVFNLFNENKVTAVNSNTGSAFENAISILGPRVLRIGARFTF